MSTSRLITIAIALAALAVPATAFCQGETAPKVAAPVGESPFQGSAVSNIYTADISDPDRAFYGLDLPQHVLYRGIIPHVRDTLPHIYPHQVIGLHSRTNRLTWIGFQKMPDKTRVFLQTYGVPAFRIERGMRMGEIVVVLLNTRPSLTNFLRLVDSRWIPRSISGIKARRRGRNTHVHIHMRRNVEFSVSIDGPYLNVDFDDSHLEKEWNEGRGDTVYDDPNEDNTYNDPSLD